MTPLEREMVLQAIAKNPELASSFAKGKALGQFTKQTASGIGNMADDANRAFGGPQFVDDVLGMVPKGKGGETLAKIVKSGPMRFAGRALPILTAASAVGDVGDIVLGSDSLANKAMDTTAMGLGGTIGGVISAGNPIAIAAGANLGKSVSDGIQGIFGGGKSAEQRKLEEALMLLRGGNI